MKLYKRADLAARAWAVLNGLRGAKGGWIYDGQRPYCQGYGELARRLIAGRNMRQAVIGDPRSGWILQ